MKLYSDLHLDCSPCVVSSDGIVAGDVSGSVPCLAIQGNHDVIDGWEFASLPSHVEGRRLIGGVGWTDWGFPGRACVGNFDPRVLMACGVKWTPDVSGMPEGVLGIDYIMNEHFKFVLGCNSSEHTLIVTHHPPVSRACIRLGSDASRYDVWSEHGFYSPMLARCFYGLYDSIMEYGLTWGFGHTHERIDLVLDCRYADPVQLPKRFEALQIENWFRVTRREFGAPYVDQPGFVRLVSNPRGYTNVENYSQFGSLYTGVEI